MKVFEVRPRSRTFFECFDNLERGRNMSYKFLIFFVSKDFFAIFSKTFLGIGELVFCVVSTQPCLTKIL